MVNLVDETIPHESEHCVDKNLLAGRLAGQDQVTLIFREKISPIDPGPPVIGKFST